MQRLQALGFIALLILMSPRASALEAQEDSRRQPGAGASGTPPSQAEQEEARRRAQAEQEEARRRAEAERRAAEERARAEAEKMKREAEEERARAEKQKEEAEEEAERAEAEKKKKKSAGAEPELNLPIRYFVYSAVLSGLGYATGLLSAGPERDLRNPAKHRTQDETLTLYRKARYGGLLSKGFYSLSGAVGGYGAYKTQSAVREYLTAKAEYAMQQKQAEHRPAQSPGSQDMMAAKVTQALLVPPVPDSAEILVPEPPPIQAGIFLGPSGDTSLSLSVRF